MTLVTAQLLRTTSVKSSTGVRLVHEQAGLPCSRTALPRALSDMWAASSRPRSLRIYPSSMQMCASGPCHPYSPCMHHRAALCNGDWLPIPVKEEEEKTPPSRTTIPSMTIRHTHREGETAPSHQLQSAKIGPMGRPGSAPAGGCPFVAASRQPALCGLRYLTNMNKPRSVAFSIRRC